MSLNNAWAEAIREVAALVRKAGAAFFAFLAGKKAGTDAAEDRARRAADKAGEKQDETDRDYDRLRRNEPLRERLRDLMGLPPRDF